MKFLHTFKTFLRDVLRDRSTTLEQYILARNPQTPLHVEQLEREYYAKLRRGSMV
jgi:hypothetical protein